MTTQTSIELPYDTKIVDENGNITQVWTEALGAVFKAASVLRDAAALMDDLSPASTAAEISAAWEEFRTKLQEIS